jgi:uncharacterized surface protein with fasciclin (FAS1) repeats
MAPENKLRLVDLLNNHIVKGMIHFKDLKDGDSLETVNGNQLAVTVQDGKVTIRDANVLGRDAKITNVTMHSIDTVITKKYFRSV